MPQWMLGTIITGFFLWANLSKESCLRLID